MKLKCTLGLLLTLFVLFIVYSHASQTSRRKPDLAIAYTNDVLGEIEPCG